MASFRLPHPPPLSKIEKERKQKEKQTLPRCKNNNAVAPPVSQTRADSQSASFQVGCFPKGEDLSMIPLFGWMDVGVNEDAESFFFPP